MQSLDDDFPYLSSSGYSKTSPSTPFYNCIAWAAGDNTRWWWPDPGFQYYWPPQIPFKETLETFEQLFALLGYRKCDTDSLEVKFEKIAIYGEDNKVKHAARQLNNGSWTSKLGQNIDISHSLKALVGPKYGKLLCFMKRQINN